MKETLRIHAADGYPISVTAYQPARANEIVVLINSATGVRQEFYADFASWFADQGFRVFTYDYRGIGRSRPAQLRGFQANMHEWGTLDYHAVLKHLFLSYTESRFVVIGHSVGGQLIGMSPLSENVDRIITIGAQVPFYQDFPAGLNRLKLLTFWYVMIPVLTSLFRYFPARAIGLFEDLPAGVARQWARWAQTRNYVFDEVPSLKERYATLNHPALMVSFSDDAYAPPKAVGTLMRYYSRLRWEHWIIHPRQIRRQKIGHFGFFRRQCGLTLWAHLQGWIVKSAALSRNKAA